VKGKERMRIRRMRGIRSRREEKRKEKELRILMVRGNYEKELQIPSCVI